MKETSGRRLTFLATLIASVLLLCSLRLPLWHMRLEAPQYRAEEALKIAVHPNAMKGDLRELKVLNQYIGVHVPPTLPQFSWLPWAITTAGVLGVVMSFASKRIRSKALALIACSLAVALFSAAVQARSQMHDIGHKRDQKTVLAGMHDFTPPFLGTTKIAQFTVSSRLGAGAWLVGGAVVLQLAAGAVARERKGSKRASDTARKTTKELNEPAGTARFTGGYKEATP